MTTLRDRSRGSQYISLHAADIDGEVPENGSARQRKLLLSPLPAFLNRRKTWSR